MGSETPSQPIRQDPTLHAREIDTEQTHLIFQSDDGSQYEKYVVTNDGSSEFQNSYEFRINNKHNELVDVIYAGPQQNHFGCTLRTKYDVVTQRIPYRLAHLPTQHAYNSLILLRVALTGFRDVFKYHGLISVKDSMIGITPKNKVKVWLNPNFSINRPQEKSISLQKLDPKDHQREMVNNIFDLVSSKAEQESLWIDLAHRREINDPRTFDQALVLVQNFIEAKGLRLFDQLRNPFNKPSYEPRAQTFGLINMPDEQFPPTYERPIHAIPPDQSYYHQQVPPVPVHVGSNSNASIIAQTPYFGQQAHSLTPLVGNQSRGFRPFEEIERRMIPNKRRLNFSQSSEKAPVNNRILISSQQNLNPINVSKPVIKFGHLNRPIPIASIKTTVNKLPNEFGSAPRIGMETYSRSPIKQIVLNVESTSVNMQQKQQNYLNKQDMKVANEIKSSQFSNSHKDIENISQVKTIPTEKVEQVITFKNIQQHFQNNPMQQPISQGQPIIQLSPEKSKQQTLKQSHYNIQVHNISSESQQSSQQDQISISKKEEPQIQSSNQQINHIVREDAILRSSQKEHPYKFILSMNDSSEHNQEVKQRLQNLQSLKTAVKASLIDSKDIRHQTEVDKEQKKWSGPRLLNTNKSISYREMRRLLLEATGGD